MKLVFATNNKNKVKEINALLEGRLEVVGLSDIGCEEAIPETADTLEGNALQKARFVAEKYGYDCFADDTGLEVNALGGKPGVYTARYAGPQCSASDNMEKILNELAEAPDRTARFRTVIALIINGEEKLFEGVAKGKIANSKSGGEGFGYDPVFVPEGHVVTFAEMSMEAKNAISHRGAAVRKLITYLSSRI